MLFCATFPVNHTPQQQQTAVRTKRILLETVNFQGSPRPLPVPPYQWHYLQNLLFQFFQSLLLARLLQGSHPVLDRGQPARVSMRCFRVSPAMPRALVKALNAPSDITGNIPVTLAWRRQVGFSDLLSELPINADRACSCQGVG